MAKIYPENLITHRTRTPSEEKFLRSVREKLSDEWTVFVNLEYTSAPDFRRVSGEIDFLLFHEIFGIVIAEVKGGTLSSELGGEHWLQGSRPCKKDPWAQAQSQKKFLLRYFHANYGVAYLPFAVAALPCFPDCAFREEFPPETRGNALWADDIEGDLEAFLVNFLRNSRDRSQVVHAAEFFDTALLRCALQSLFETAEKLRDRSKEERSVLLKLTHEQGRALNAESCGRRRFRVCGSVGTGKTLIALEKAKRLAAQGESVLLLCYNILLSEFLISSVQAFPNVVAAAFSDFACDALGISEEEREAAAKKNEAGRDAFFDGLPKKLCAFLQKFPRKFDAVIIDEAQDFSEDMWRAVESLTRDDGRFIVFYDPNQNIFRERLAFPPSLADAPEFRLSLNCRNTKNIFREIQKCLPNDAEIFPGSPEGERVEEFFPETAAAARGVLETALHNLRTRSVLGNEITILGARGDFRKTSIGENEEIDAFRIASPKSRKFAQRIVEYFTCLRFKGCETGTLILIDVDPASEDWDPQRLYTSVSRAVNRLIIIHAPLRAEKDAEAA